MRGWGFGCCRHAHVSGPEACPDRLTGCYGTFRSVAPSAPSRCQGNRVSGMPCCAGWTSMSYWSMEGGIHCSACPDSAGGKAPGFRLGRCVVRLLGSTASSGSGAGTVGRRVFRPSAVSGQGSCKDIETGWVIPVGRGAGAVPSLGTPGLRGPTGQRIGKHYFWNTFIFCLHVNRAFIP